MSKREASEYITKEDGSTANLNAAEIKPSMATAAQLAKRKIATPRSRLNGRATTPSTPSSNPFAMSPHSQQTFAPVGGMVFGASQSQSFPTGAPTSGFTFDAPQPASNPFNNAPFNNPFGNINGTNSAPFENANGAFGANSMNTGKRSSDDMMMESPEKKAGGHVFGKSQGFEWANSPQQQQQQQQQSSTPAFSFGGSQNNSSKSTGGLFGNVSKPEQPQQSNLFGQVQPSQPSFSFGQGTSQAPSFSFGQTQPKEQTPTPPPSFNTDFGQTTTTQAPATPKFTFGQPATTQTSRPALSGQSSAQQPAAGDPLGSDELSRASSPFKFGGTQAATSAPANPFGGIQAPAPAAGFSFGQKSESTCDKPETPKTASSLFGQTTASQPPTALFGQTTGSQPPSNLFGQPASPAKTATTFSFGQPVQAQSSATEEKPSEAAKNLFSGLFNSAAATTQSSAEPASATAPTPKSNLFSFGAIPTTSIEPLDTLTITSAAANLSSPFGIPTTSQPVASSTFTFGSPSKESDALRNSESTAAPKSPEKIYESVPTKPAFSFGGSQMPSSGGLFTPSKPAATNKAPMTEPPKMPPFGGGAPLFQNDPAQAPEPATEKRKKPLFGRTLDGSSTLSQPAAPEPTVQPPLFGAQPASKPTISGPTPQEEPPTSSSSFAAPPARQPAIQSSANASQPITSGPPPQRPVYTKSPGRIPNYINGEGYKEFDNNYRLRALNREFQRRVAALDPSRHDFENIIRHYVAARASIGADIGLYQRTMAGTKRKNDTVDEEELEVPQQYKRAKSNDGQAAAPQQPAAQSNMFGNSAPAATQSSAASSSNPSKATSMLNQMIPRSPQRTPNPPKTSDAKKPTSVFASIPDPPAGPSFIRGLLEDIENGTSIASQSAPSTTPAKPLPAPSFGMPTPSTTNGFAAFASQAAKIDKKRKAERLEDEYSSDEDSQAEGRKKLEEEERAKRVKYDSIPKTGFTPSFGVRPSVEKSTSPSKSPPKSGFTPLFGGNAQNMTFPSKYSPKVKRNRPFEPDSSEEEEDNEEDHADDEETTEEKDGEFAPEDEGSSEESQEAENEEDDLPEDDVEEDADDDDVDHQAMIDANPNKGKSLFDRIEPNPVMPAETPVNGEKTVDSGFQFPKSDGPIMASAKKNGYKPSVWGAHIGKSTPDAPAFSPITPATSSPYKPATTFNFTPTPATTTPTPAPGASVLSGGLTAGSYTKFDGMFGSRPTTPNPFETEAPTPPSGPADHTWKAGSPIKFGETPEKAPKINLTAASPEKDGDTTPKPASFGSLFGTAPASTSKAGDTNLGFSFGGSKPAPDFLSASRIGAGLTPLSGLSSGLSSRGTSPGLTDAESVATDTSDNMPAEPQTSFLDSRAGEENEVCLFEARSKALKFITEEAAKTSKKLPNTWQTMGVGPLRLLKNKETGKCRILLRAEPGANIIVNAYLLPTMEYSSIDQGKSGAVKGALFNAKDNKLERWVFKLKTHEMAIELDGLMKANQMSPVAKEDT